MAHLRNLGFVGQIAPFFLKRVFNLKLALDAAGNPVKRLLRKSKFLPHNFFKKLYRTAALIEVQICLDCHFVQTKEPFPEDLLGRLYFDYRSDNYNAERISFEPEYQTLAQHVGRSAQETEARVATLTAWLKDRIDFDNDFSMLDYGGGDGRFLPRMAAKKYVYDISDTRPLDGVTRIGSKEQLTSYSYVQLAHILEHVPDPLTTMRKLLPNIRAHGYFYIEVPQDLDDERISRYSEGIAEPGIPIHEHINFYTGRAVTELIRAVGLRLVDVQIGTLDLGWSKPTIIRGLARQ